MGEFVKAFGKYVLVAVLGALALLGGGTYSETLKVVTSDDAAAAYCKNLVESKPSVAEVVKDAFVTNTK